MLNAPSYWLLKTEPHVWSWAQQCASKEPVRWDGVRNPQALKFMRAMVLGDQGFFYHTGSERRIMGVVRVVQTFKSDPQNPHEGWVKVEALYALHQPVALSQIKAHPEWRSRPLLKQPRLSVMPIDPQDSAWIHQVSATPQSF